MPEEMWRIDAQDYHMEPKRARLLECYETIRRDVLHHSEQSDLILVTKIMLGVFGSVPAFDDFFTSTFRELYGKENGCAFRAFGQDALLKISEFYDYHRDQIDDWARRIKTLSFKTTKETDSPYTKAKIIDMIGFQMGKNCAEKAKEEERIAKEKGSR